METMKQIAGAFIKAKKAFSPALKDKTNPAFKSRYADLSACLEAVNDALLDNGIAVYQETFDDPSGITVETVFLHESGETMRCGKLHVPAAKQDPQGYGSALTYCRRYSLMTACGIAPEDDDGNAAQRQPAKPEARLTSQQAAEIKKLLQDTASDTTAFLSWVAKGVGAHVPSVDAMPASAYEPAKQRLISKQKENAQ